jgi:hypothetical protein
MPYIFEMDVALLRMQYLLPDNHHISNIDVSLNNYHPYDRTNMVIEYSCVIASFINDEFKPVKVLQADNLQYLVNLCRIWSILYNHQSTNNSNN